MITDNNVDNMLSIISALKQFFFTKKKGLAHKSFIRYNASMNLIIH